MEFKDKLPIIRKRKGMSQEKLAEMVGISRQAVAKWELGQGYPDIENLILLSDIFKMSVDRLIKPEDDHYFLSYCKKEETSEEGLINFLLKAKRSTYAANATQVEASRPNSHDLMFQEGEFLYIDTYLGGEEFGGEEAVWQQGIPVWTMNYHGHVIGSNFSGDFLKEALLLVPTQMPFRGPELYQNGDYIYHCNITGDLSWFQGLEEIYCKTDKIYECHIHGGKIR